MSDTDADTRAAAAPDADDELGAEAAGAERVPWWQRFVTGSSTWIGLILVALILVFSALEFSSFVSASVSLTRPPHASGRRSWRRRRPPS